MAIAQPSEARVYRELMGSTWWLSTSTCSTRGMGKGGGSEGSGIEESERGREGGRGGGREGGEPPPGDGSRGEGRGIAVRRHYHQC